VSSANSSSFFNNAANQQLVFSSKSMVYDLNGNLTTLTDPSGTTTYTWDDTNPLSELTPPNNKGPEARGPCVCKKRDSRLHQPQFPQLFRRWPALAVPAADLVVFI
jgi:YD repeat-containing protein